MIIIRTDKWKDGKKKERSLFLTHHCCSANKRISKNNPSHCIGISDAELFSIQYNPSKWSWKYTDTYVFIYKFVLLLFWWKERSSSSTWQFHFILPAHLHSLTFKMDPTKKSTTTNNKRKATKFVHVFQIISFITLLSYVSLLCTI